MSAKPNVFFRTFFIVAFASLCSYCEGSSDSDDPEKEANDSSSDADSDSDSDSDSDTDVDSDGDADGDDLDEGEVDVGEVCQAPEVDVDRAPGRLMILQDISISMFEYDENDTDAPLKWDQAKAAMDQVLKKYKGKGVAFGFDLFPDGSEDANGSTRCGVSNGVIIDTALDQEKKIINEFDERHEAGATPIYLAMQNFTDPNYAPLFSAEGSTRILLLVTDGQDNCGKEGKEPSWTASENAFIELTKSLRVDHGINTAVVGFGEGVSGGTNEDKLNAIAANGGTDFKEMIKADNQKELAEALGRVTGLIVNCVFDIKLEEDADPDKVNFYFDGVVVPHDKGCKHNAEGWTWTNDKHVAVMFCEKSCTKLQKEVDKVSAEFGCNTVVY